MKMPQLRHRRRDDDPDPLCEVRQATEELEQLLNGVLSGLDAAAADVNAFADTAARLRDMADEAARIAKGRPDA